MIPYSEWLDAAKALPEGIRKRINHTCGGGSTMIINHDDKGFSCHCFRCNDGGFMGHGIRPISKLFQQRKELDYAKQKVVHLPTDCIPLLDCVDHLALVWLGGAGITPSQIEQYGIVYSPGLRRVVLPVYVGGELVFHQARAVHPGHKPKYLNPLVDRCGILYTSLPDVGDGRVVVVEDILSAIRVGTHCKAVSLLGTNINEGQASLLSEYARLTLWLDGDKAGVAGAKKVRDMLSCLMPVDTITTEKDPKDYTNREIKELLS